MNTELLLPDSDLPGDLAALAKEMRVFAMDVLQPHARAVDEERRFRRETVAELAAAGVLGGPIAAAYGGRGWSPLDLAVAHEEIGAVCGNTRGFLAVHTGLVTQCIERFGDDRQVAKWLPALVEGRAIGCFALTENGAGSDVASLQTRAARAGAGYALTGEKVWITNGGIADIAIVFATVDPVQGRKGITAFLVETDRPGLQRLPVEGIELGHRGSDHARLVFDSVQVPDEAVLGGVGEGFGVAMGALKAGRLSVAAGAVGIHRAALQAAAVFAEQRVQFGKQIRDFQMVQERLADMLVELLAARQLVHRAARRREAGTETPVDLAAAKAFATEAAARAADQAVQLHGARGYSSAWPVERLLRDAAGLRIYEGTTLIQKAILARTLFS